MADRNKCFLSYAQVDEEFVNEYIIPSLLENEVEIFNQNISDIPVYYKKNFIVDSILKSDFVVCLLNKRSTYVNLELGTAIGNNKPVFALIADDNSNEIELDFINYILYNKAAPNDLAASLRRAFETVNENVINKTASVVTSNETLIGIRVGYETSDYERELEFTLEFVKLLNSFSEGSAVTLVQTSKGTLTSLLGVDLKPLTDLAEKLFFFPAELKKKYAEAEKAKAEVNKVNAETDKTKAETDKTKAEADKTEAETEKIRAETKALEQDRAFQNAEKMLGLLKRFQDLGVTVQLDNQVTISTKPDGTIEFKQPKNLE